LRGSLLILIRTLSFGMGFSTLLSLMFILEFLTLSLRVQNLLQDQLRLKAEALIRATLLHPLRVFLLIPGLMNMTLIGRALGTMRTVLLPLLLLFSVNCGCGDVSVTCHHEAGLCEPSDFTISCHDSDVCQYCEWNKQFLCDNVFQKDSDCHLSQEMICTPSDLSPCQECLGLTVTRCYR